MRWGVLNRLKASHPKLEVHNTYGYRTKHARIANGIAKSHCADAFCIAGEHGISGFPRLFRITIMSQASISTTIFAKLEAAKQVFKIVVT
jgi:hypothetical protein